ncbi:MAG: BTAD domain-containing putative transcriptional regulator [bacterium]
MKQNSLLESIFIGRKKEIAFIKNKFTHALGNSGNCLFVTGETGIGKSRLVDEFISSNAGNALVFRLDAKAHTSSVRDFFAEIIRLYLQSISHSARTITKFIDDQMYNEFADTLPELSLYYPYEAKTRDKAVTGSEMYALFYRFLSNITGIAPVVMIIDDFHESAGDVRDMLEYFLQHIGNGPTFLILIARENPAFLKWFDTVKSHSVERMVLHHLDEEELMDLNAALFKNEMDEAFIKWLGVKTKGVPLFLKEFLYAMFEKGVIYYDSENTRWKAISAYSRIAIPDRVTEIIRTRFQNIPHDNITFLKVASVMGENFDPSLPILNAKKNAISSLRRMGFIAKKHDEYAFTHPLIRETLYEQIPVQERIKLHKNIGNFYFEHGYKRQAAEQLLSAHEKSETLLKLLLVLGEDSRQAGDYARSNYYFENALAIARQKKKISPKKLVNIILDFSKSLFLYEKYGQVFDLSITIISYIKKHQLRVDDKKLLHYYNELTQTYIHLGKYQEALKTANKGLRIIENAKPGKFIGIELELVMNRAFLFKNMGKVDKALEQVLKIKDLYAETASSFDRYNIYRLLGAIYNEKHDFKQAIIYREAALVAAQETQVGHIIAAALGNLGVSYANSGELKKGMGYLRQYQNYNMRTGRLRAEIVSYIHIAQIYFNQGYLTQADTEFNKGIKRWVRFGKRLKEVQYELEYRYGTFLVVVEEYEQAREHLMTALKLAEEFDNQTVKIYPLLNLGCLYVGIKDKKSLNKTLKTISASFKDKAKEFATFNILQGFQSLFKKNRKQGLEQIENGLQLLRSMKNETGLFRLLYLCIIYLIASKADGKIIRQYMTEAQDIATRLHMTGWLERFDVKQKKPVTEPLKINCFGSFHIEHPVRGLISDEQWQRAKPKQLLSILISSMLTGSGVDRAKIGSMLWPELSTEKMINNFHVCLHQLKAIIGKDYVKYAKGAYKLDNVWLDVHEFKQLLNDAERLFQEGKIHLAELKLKDAIELYQGDFLEDTYDPWVEDVRNMYAALYRNRMLMLGRIYFKKLKFESAIQLGKTILASDPFNEEGHRFLMRAHLGSGEKAKAINQYKKCVELFKRELNCLPSEETQQVYKKLL